MSIVVASVLPSVLPFSRSAVRPAPAEIVIGEPGVRRGVTIWYPSVDVIVKRISRDLRDAPAGFARD